MKTWMTLMVFLGMYVGSITTMAGPRQERLPPWIDNPKMPDSVYLYVIGTSEGQSSAAVARQAALEDAQRQLSQMIVREAGVGDHVLDALGLLPLRAPEPIPGCYHRESNWSGHAAWIQVSFPLSEKRTWIERLRREAN